MDRSPPAAATTAGTPPAPDVSAAAPGAATRAPRTSRAKVLLALAAFTALVVGASGIIALLVALARYVDHLV
jgi:hypothetical protein